MGLLAHALRPSRSTLGRPPLPFYLVQRLGTNSTKPHHLRANRMVLGMLRWLGTATLGNV
jgi:hypothetical protein